MKNKTLFIILLVPFLVAILGFANIIIATNLSSADILGINWDYRANTGFKIRDEGYILEATPIINEDYILAEGNDLIWYTSNSSLLDDSQVDSEGNPLEVGEIRQDSDGSYYFYALNEGTIFITCDTVKGSDNARTMTATVYEDSVVIINSNPERSGYQIDQTRYFGQYDYDSNYNKVNASFTFDVDVYDESGNVTNSYDVIDSSSNISVDGNSSRVTINSASENSYFTLSGRGNLSYITGSYSFSVVSSGVNIYSYNELLRATNMSSSGEIVCLQVNLESLANTYVRNDDGSYRDEYLNENTRLFGNYNFSNQSFNFDSEVYRFKTTYNSEYISDLYGENSDELTVLSGIHVQKDFYGNGYTINGHELCYPKNGVTDSSTGEFLPGEGDLFKGPRTFVSLLVLTQAQTYADIMSVFGQDNSLMYVHGNNITINDLNIQNTQEFDLNRLTYVGSNIDVLGRNVTIKNSTLTYARDNLRVYSSDGFTLDNSIISRNREFGVKFGCNEYIKVDENKNVEIVYGDQNYSGPIGHFMDETNYPEQSDFGGDNLLLQVVMMGLGQGSVNVEDALAALNSLQEGLDNTTGIVDSDGNVTFGQNVTINDTYFDESGIFSVAMDSYFNGPFLYDMSPQIIVDLFAQLLSMQIQTIDNISGTMLPTNLTVTGDTRFYDYKNVDSIDASCLIRENISSLGDIASSANTIEIDDYFPMKKLLKEEARRQNYLYNVTDSSSGETTSYLATPFAFYGGGLNLSSINYDGITNKFLGDSIEVNIAESSISSDTSGGLFAFALSICIPIAAGYHPFNFITSGEVTSGVEPYLFSSSPSRNDLINRV